MITLRRSDERGRFNLGWLDTRHTFSFGRYHDPEHMGFRALRVINEDIVAPSVGFGEHPHRDMEIVTYVVAGQLTHRDSMGNEHTVGPGGVQAMTAGTGVRHSEINPSPDQPVHLLQIWILPDRTGRTPRYQQTTFDPAARRDRLCPIATPDGRDGSVAIHQDAAIFASILGAGRELRMPLAPGRHAWVQLIRGRLDLNGAALSSGDGAAITGEDAITLAARDEAELLAFDLA